MHTATLFLSFSVRWTTVLTRLFRVFQAEAALILAKTIYAFDLELSDKTDKDWMNQSAYLVFEPKPIYVNLTERSI